MISCVLPGEKRVLRDRDSSISLVLFSGNLENGCWLSFVGEEEKETVGCLLFRKFPLVHRQRLFSQLGSSRSGFEPPTSFCPMIRRDCLFREI
jgi:hypothetical protein